MSRFAEQPVESSRYARFLATELRSDPDHRFFGFWMAEMWAAYQLRRGFWAANEADAHDPNQREARRAAVVLWRHENAAKFNHWLGVL